VTSDSSLSRFFRKSAAHPIGVTSGLYLRVIAHPSQLTQRRISAPSADFPKRLQTSEKYLPAGGSRQTPTEWPPVSKASKSSHHPSDYQFASGVIQRKWSVLKDTALPMACLFRAAMPSLSEEQHYSTESSSVGQAKYLHDPAWTELQWNLAAFVQLDCWLCLGKYKLGSRNDERWSLFSTIGRRRDRWRWQPARLSIWSWKWGRWRSYNLIQGIEIWAKKTLSLNA